MHCFEDNSQTLLVMTLEQHLGSRACFSQLLKRQICKITHLRFLNKDVFKKIICQSLGHFLTNKKKYMLPSAYFFLFLNVFFFLRHQAWLQPSLNPTHILHFFDNMFNTGNIFKFYLALKTKQTLNFNSGWIPNTTILYFVLVIS